MIIEGFFVLIGKLRLSGRALNVSGHGISMAEAAVARRIFADVTKLVGFCKRFYLW